MPDRERASEIEDVAVVWVARTERGLTPQERTELDGWLEVDSRHLGAFVRAQAASIHAERASALGKMPERQATMDIVELPFEEPKQPRLTRRMALGGGGALAASIAAGYFVAAERYHTLESSVGEIRHIALKGGTTLTLDTDTRVDLTTSSEDRRLTLVRGKIFLDVARRGHRPLLVQTRDLLFETAEGAFALQSLADNPLMAIVIKGQLAVSQGQGLFQPKRGLIVGRNHSLTLRSGGDLVTDDVQPMAAMRRDQLLAWRDGMLSFGGEALAYAVRAFDRYGPTRIEVDPELADERITGLFKATDPKGFAAAVAASFGGSVSDQGDVLRITAKKLPSA